MLFICCCNAQIWILTGDKVETAINIGRSCRLLTDMMTDDNLIVMDIDEALPEERAKVRVTCAAYFFVRGLFVGLFVFSLSISCGDSSSIGVLCVSLSLSALSVGDVRVFGGG